MSGQKPETCPAHSGLVQLITGGFESVEEKLVAAGGCIREIKQGLFIGSGEAPALVVRVDRLEQQQQTGPDGKKTPLAVRLDRLEQQAESRKWAWRVGMGALILMTINAGWSLAVKVISLLATGGASAAAAQAAATGG